MSEENDREAMADGLEQLAGDIRAGLILPYDISVAAFWRDRKCSAHITTDDARAAMTVLPGNWSKSWGTNYLTYRKAYAGGLVNYEITIPREQVCSKIKTGTRTVPAEPEHEEDTFEWVCDPGDLP